MTILREYLHRTGVEPLRSVGFRWDHWNRAEYFFFALEDDIAAFETLDFNQNLSVCCAIAEWMTYLLKIQANAKANHLLEYVEACWLSQLEDYEIETNFESSDEWAGPAQGALYLALIILEDFVTESDHDLKYGLRSCWMTNLARHVLGDGVGQFDAWLDGAITRFEGNRSQAAELVYKDVFDSHFERGNLVSPRMFVLDRTYSAEDDSREMESLTGKTNAFVR